MQAGKVYPIHNLSVFKQQLLSWANQFSSCCFLDNHQYASPWQQQECLLAVGAKAMLQTQAGKALAQIDAFTQLHRGQWIFGHLGYGLTYELMQQQSQHPHPDSFADACLFVPEIVLQCNDNSVCIYADDVRLADEIFKAIKSQYVGNASTQSCMRIGQMTPVLSQAQYLQAIATLQQHILRGDCYEINFCQQFLVPDSVVDPVALYLSLCEVSPNPFSCYYKIDSNYLACASPERFLMKRGSKLYSQPIKGTASRHKYNADTDETLKQQLQQSEKDRSENVMVVDLVRNDLSQICNSGSVQVAELFGIYTFPQVHQMISTIEGELRPGTSFGQILQATFPMGSMTGAPKPSVVSLIDKYEQGQRGIFSGSVGYIQPNGDFDFNVVIRSIVYEQTAKLLHYHVGSGITHYSVPEKEYEECRWKSAAIEQVLSNLQAQ